jgi:RimJ/RimL family protein N-acetyltransferase
MLLETKRMIIRAFTMQDAGDLHDILGDSKTMEMCEPAYALEKTKKFLKEFCIGQNGALAAIHRETQKVIGYILFSETQKGVYEIGWIFNRACWRKGYAYEACRAVMAYAFFELNAHKIFAETIDGIKSIGLMKKLGMSPEGVQREQTKDNSGEWADLYLYGILQSEW